MSYFRQSRSFLLIGVILIGSTQCRAEDPVSTFGLGTLVHPIQEPSTAPVQPSGADNKGHVYIFAVNGTDPLCFGNFNGLCAYLQKCGFQKTYFGRLSNSHGFAKAIRQIRQMDPHARIVLIGFSSGCHYVKGIANTLAQDGTRVDLLVNIAGVFITNTPASFPENVGRVLNIRAKGFIDMCGDLFCTGEIDGAWNCQVDCGHFVSPSRRETLELVMAELHSLSGAPAPP